MEENTKKERKNPNPAGGKLQKRALVKLLSQKVQESYRDTGKSVEEIIAELVLNIALTGEVKLYPAEQGEGATVMEFDPRDWFEIVRWIYDRIEGKPTQAIDNNVGGSLFFDVESTIFSGDKLLKEVQNEVDRTNELLPETEHVSGDVEDS